MLYLGGGGSDDDERALWVEAFRSGSSIVVLPLAQSGLERQEATTSWFTAAIAPLGRFRVASATDGPIAEQLGGADTLAIPGGNTFLLLSELRCRGLVDAILAFVERGGSVYGGSAGASLMGADIDIALIADANDVALEDTRGLDLLEGADALPHFSDDQRPFARERAARCDRTIICIPENAGVVVADGVARNVGPGTVSIVTPSSEMELRPSETWTLRGATDST